MGHGKDGQQIIDDGIAAQDGDFNLSQTPRGEIICMSPIFFK
jgi:hypothetical protein